ncbi:carboxypeptidase-like regulatory domain-containing protein [Chitinophaga niabensis]|uniref:Carboxypeptidase regulatory-like domain-containing protein n=1 Tax=Chitinophaga niabensis TaxID=536979 RepID=A0A1N6JCT7_9BACT|nr:carboxypeptidase-like regulatory domain-containing protein [Chitinophaga niabensis]SIO42100.1 Carboxypeptidase regulatory-like domain-containing protein [Chitinophaga niabensis]
MKLFISLLCTMLAFSSMAQQLPRQTIKGLVTDRNTHQPLPGVTVAITTTSAGTATDEKGAFRIPGIPVGRHNIKVTLMGYEAAILNNVEVNAGKETVLEIALTETVLHLSDVTITGRNKQQAINPLAQISARQLSMEEGMRYAGTRNDPARMAQNFAGVSGSNDASNDIIVRGNSSAGVLWRMEGVDIPNPNHFSTLGATSGPVTILNTNTLRNSDFLTGAFPAPYGNALAGAFDLRLRNGNSDKYEFLAQIGFNGFEAAAEGPIGKPGKASFLLDYRYSLLAAVQALGVKFGTGSTVPYYQDLNMKIHLPTKNAGTFNIFALGGLSKIHFNSGDDTTGLYGDGERDAHYRSNTGVLGITHSYNFSANTFGRAYAAVSLAQNTADEFLVENEVITEPAVVLDYKLTRGSVGYQLDHRFSARNQLSGGVSGELMNLRLHQQLIKDGDSVLRTYVNTNRSTGFVKGWLNWQHRFSNTLIANAGVYAQYFLLNNSFSIEPRFNLKYQAFSLGLGLHSQLQPMEIYFYETNGQLSNKGLGTTRSLHLVLGYNKDLGGKLRFKTEVYYQHLFDAPVERMPSTFSLLNNGALYGFANKEHLINDGIGRNYGAELTLEKFLQKGFYFLFTQSVFSSRYQGSDKVWRNTAFNTQYVSNFLVGKEWTIKPGFNIGADSKLSYSGGQWYTPFDVPATIAKGYAIYQEDKAFSERNRNYFRWDLKCSFTWESGSTTHKFYIDLQNLTGRKNIFTRRIKPASGTITEVNQMGFFPNVNYQFIF